MPILRIVLAAQQDHAAFQRMSEGGCGSGLGVPVAGSTDALLKRSTFQLLRGKVRQSEALELIVDVISTGFFVCSPFFTTVAEVRPARDRQGVYHRAHHSALVVLIARMDFTG